MKKAVETKVVCPHCGAEFAIPEHEHAFSGVAVGKDSGLGTIVLTPAGDPKKTLSDKTGKRLDELKAKGIDTSKFFSILNDKGEGVAMKWVDGIPVAVTDAELDELEKSIYKNGYVKNTRLYRRFLLAQLIRMMNYERGGFTQALHKHGYNYQWKMAIEEIRVLSRLEKLDPVCFDERKRWFTSDVIYRMLRDYADQLEKYIDILRIRKCKGVPYKKINGKNIFVSDIASKIYNPLNTVSLRASCANTYDELYRIISGFKPILPTHWAKQSADFVDAYKGEGAFYALKNLILFHECKVCTESGRWLNKYESMAYVNRKADEYRGEGWRLFGLMKKVIEDNKFDFSVRMRQLGVRGY